MATHFFLGIICRKFAENFDHQLGIIMAKKSRLLERAKEQAEFCYQQAAELGLADAVIVVIDVRGRQRRIADDFAGQSLDWFRAEARERKTCPFLVRAQPVDTVLRLMNRLNLWVTPAGRDVERLMYGPVPEGMFRLFLFERATVAGHLLTAPAIGPIKEPPAEWAD